MTSTTEHRSGGPDEIGPGPAEVTAAIPRVAHRQPGAGFPQWTGPDAPPAPAWLTSAPGPPPWPGPGAWAPPSSPAGLPAGFDPHRARPAGMRWGWIVIGVVAAALAVALLASFASAQRTMSVQGSVTLNVTYGALSPGTSCTGAGMYSWLEPGTAVTISDAKGTMVGTTTLSSGTAYASGSSSYGSYADTCVFPFTLTDVPAGDDFYRVGVGNTAGSGVPFTAAQLRTGGATISYGR